MLVQFDMIFKYNLDFFIKYTSNNLFYYIDYDTFLHDFT